MSLRIGILVCDHVDQDYQEEFGDYDEMFTSLLKAEDDKIQVTVFDLVSDQVPTDVNDCDAYIITGSRLGVYEDIPWIHSAKELVKSIFEAKIPTVGICFGHQLIADALDGKVIKAVDKGHALGVQTWNITDHLDWMGDESLSSFSLNASHQDQVIQLPEGAQLFASSDFCPIAGFQLDSMLAFQGHPEFGRDYTEYLIEKHQKKLDPTSKETTLKSLEIHPDSAMIGYWMMRFIKSKLGQKLT